MPTKIQRNVDTFHDHLQSTVKRTFGILLFVYSHMRAFTSALTGLHAQAYKFFEKETVDNVTATITFLAILVFYKHILLMLHILVVCCRMLVRAVRNLFVRICPPRQSV
jgi:uncharacterized membrane protein YqgA involved in biofilm formation